MRRAFCSLAIHICVLGDFEPIDFAAQELARYLKSITGADTLDKQGFIIGGKRHIHAL